MLAEGCNRIGLGTALQRMLNRARSTTVVTRSLSTFSSAICRRDMDPSAGRDLRLCGEGTEVVRRLCHSARLLRPRADRDCSADVSDNNVYLETFKLDANRASHKRQERCSPDHPTLGSYGPIGRIGRAPQLAPAIASIGAASESGLPLLQDSLHNLFSIAKPRRHGETCERENHQ